MAIEIGFGTDKYHPPRSGIYLLFGLTSFLFVLFVLRFWYLQILHGEEYAQKAHANRTRLERIYATRGIILDAKGRLLAENRPAYILALIREDCPDIPATLAQVSSWTGISLPALQAKFRQDAARVKSFQPQIVATDIPFEKVSEIEQQIFMWPGLIVETRQRRFYPHGELFAHIIGYVADASEKELRADEKLALGDIIGKQGLELVLEDRLRGTKGLNSVDVDVLGRQLNKRQVDPPLAGENIILSLDIDLQKAASEALGEEAGAVVVMEPDSGKLRALVTHPSYDNNIFTTTLSREDWTNLAQDPRHPLQNRAIQSVYPPGSVWKLIMAGLFLEQKIDPRAGVTCHGEVHLGSHTFRCWNRGGHGFMNMQQSIINSCDVYYYEMAQRVGIDNIERFATACGFGSVTGIDLPHERAGLVPGREWKKKRFRESWQGGETLNVSIGQGYTSVTPLQMAVFISALLNDGKILKPGLVENEDPVVRGMLPMPLPHRSFIVEAMRATASVGTARRISRPDAVMGGKTGTAQVVRMGERRVKSSELSYKHRDHAWMTAWGMKDGKTYTVVVMVEHGGGGSSTAGPVVARVYDALFGPAPGQPRPARGSAPQGGANAVGPAQELND
ncbi:MAG: penicillin-binding protein 2 [Desulfovibrio sp.]|jgi:penicillin-binding protein 2|nr:penicillin-binding protein 2 [Desulfovibrio sp.]